MARNPRDFAIVIGIDKYSRAGIAHLDDLEAAELDAKAFMSWLRDEAGGGLPEENIRPLLASKPRRSTDLFPYRRDIDLALQSLLGNDASSFSEPEGLGRRLYVFFAGHGLSNNAESDEVLMQLADATRTMSNYGLSLREYRESLVKEARFEEVIFILDCCRSPRPNAKGNGPGYITYGGNNRSGSVWAVTIFATGDGLNAREAAVDQANPKRRFGLLTLALLNGLQGGASDEDGSVTTNTLQKYLSAAVQELSKLARLRQVQDSQVYCGKDLSICQAAPRPAWLSVHAAAGQPEVYNHKNVPMPGEYQPARGVWEYTLPKLGLYAIRLAGADQLLLQVIPGWEYTATFGTQGQRAAWVVERRVIPPPVRAMIDEAPAPERARSNRPPAYRSPRRHGSQPGGAARIQGPPAATST